MIKRTKSKRSSKKVQNPRTSRYRESLYKLALKFDDFDDFAEFYWNGLAAGIYWIGSEHSDFVVNKPLEKEYARQGKLIAYTSPKYLDTKFAVQIDTSKMDPFQDITENKKDPNNSIKILRPDLIKSYYIYTIPKALEVHKYNIRYLPNTRYDLKEFWDYAHARNIEEQKGTAKKTVRRKKTKND